MGRRTVWMALALIGLLAAAPVAAGFPRPHGPVNDFAGVLAPAEVRQLEAISHELEAKTGAALVVAIVPTHAPEGFEDYVTKLFEQWGIGRKGVDDGVLILLAMEEGELAIEVGYGLEGVLTDARSGQIRDLMLPHFRAGRFGEGLLEGMRAIAAVIGDAHGVGVEGAGGFNVAELDRRPGPPPGLVAPALAAFLGLFVLAYWVARPKCPRCKARLRVTDKVLKAATFAAGGLALKVYTCTRCDYLREQQYRTGRLSRGGPFIGGSPWGGGTGGRSTGGKSFGGFGGGRSGGGGARGRW